MATSDTSSIHAGDVRSPANSFEHAQPASVDLHSSFSPQHSDLGEPEIGGASLWQAEQNRQRNELQELAAFHELATILNVQSIDDTADELQYFSTEQDDSDQYKINHALILSVLERLKFTGTKLALQEGEEGVLLNQVLDSLSIQCDRSEYNFHLCGIEELVVAALNNDPLAKRLRGEHWTVTMQHLDDQVLLCNRGAINVTETKPMFPPAGKRRKQHGLQSTGSASVAIDLAQEDIINRISTIILETDHPNSVAARRSDHPAQILRGAMGDTRGSTMKIYLRAWERMTSWLSMSKSLSWPVDALHVVEYLHNAIGEPCCRSHPQTIIQAVSWFERTAGVPAHNMVSKSSLFMKTVDYCTGVLSTGASPAKQAPRLPSICIASLECYICNPSYSTYLRYRAFTICFKTWASLRQDDIQHLSIGNLRLVGNFYAGELLQTKTTGPTKRVKEVPLVVAVGATLTGLPWLECGLEIAKEFDLEARPYLLPDCNSGGRSFGVRMAGYSAASAASRTVFSQLKVPTVSEIDDRVYWTDGQEVLVPPEMISFWSEHSPRACMPSWTALLGVEKSIRDLLGRWSPTGSEDYTRTYRITVRELQLAVIRAVRSKDPRLCEDDVWEKLRRYVDPVSQNETPFPMESHCAYWKKVCDEFAEQLISFGPASTCPLITPIVSTEGIDTSINEPPPNKSISNESAADYLIVYSRGRKFSRLHSTKSTCPWNKTELNDYIYVTVPLPELYDARCKICWPNQSQELLELDSDQYESSESDD